LFLLLLINKLQLPFCFGTACRFVGFSTLLRLNIIPTICLGLIVLGGVFYWRFNYRIEKAAAGLPKQIIEIEDLYFENVVFLITYIIPLVGFNLDSGRNQLTLILMLSLIGWFYVKANIFYTNPSLAVLGYRIYRIDTLESKKMIVIVRGRLKKDDDIYPRKIDDNIYFATKAKR
jgi:hypothetical protein